MTLEGVYNHLVLPPKLPGGQDPHLDEEAQDFVERLVSAVDTLDEATKEVYTGPLSTLRQSLRLCGHLNRGCLDKDTLATALKEFGDAPLILYVVEQNAALIIRQNSTNETKSVIFEAFEASPSSEDVLASENALIQTFPGRACAIPESCFHHDDFQSSLAEFLEKASMETLNRLAAHTRKAGVEVTEARDTTDPAMITQLLMPLLESLGKSVQVEKFQKRVRDDVNVEVESGTGTTLPFRRHPFWLVLRVAIQRQLILSMGYHSGRALYKSLIATVLAQLMTNVVGELKPELTLMLRAKLCRRLAKLEQERAERLGDNSVYGCFFSSMGSWMEQTIQSVTSKMEFVWSTFKRSAMRHVEPLPAAQSVPYNHLQLQLRQSGTYLEGLLRQHTERKTQTIAIDADQINDPGIKQVQKFTARYLKIMTFEDDIRNRPFQDHPKLITPTDKLTETNFDEPTHCALPSKEQQNEAEDRCVELSEYIDKYFDIVSNAYDLNPVQMSSFVLNLFHLWVLMDLAATEACHLLREYHPIFTPKLLDVLQLEKSGDFDRLSSIQKYLTHRIKNCQAESPDILSDRSSSNCFEARYMAEYSEIQSLYHEIFDDSQQARDNKEVEWKKLLGVYEQLSQEIAALSHVYSEEIEYRERRCRNCKKCWVETKRWLLSIEPHEHFLPRQENKAAKLVFELAAPRWYVAYRNATFKIICDLAWPAQVKEEPPPLILKDFDSLGPYHHGQPPTGGITLASPIKSFHQTHFRLVKMRRDSLGQVVRPHGPVFQLYDLDRKIWVKSIDRKALTFQHLCGIVPPECLRHQVLKAVLHPPPVAEGPSSYDVIANEFRCPQQVTTHEFSAYQRLLSGTSRRWLTMLVELGTSHLNFSSSETVWLFSQLSLQAGPPGLRGLRKAYYALADNAFGHRLTQLIDQKLDSIKLNWREVSLMELCITLSQRLLAFTSDAKVRENIQCSIRRARNIALGWITRLREELQNVKDGSTAERVASYAFKSALLCRRTFSTMSDQLTAVELKAYCEASIALQEHMTSGFESDPILKMMVIRDTKMDIRALVYSSLQNHPESLNSAIWKSWFEFGDSTDTRFSSWTATEGVEPWVMTRIITTMPAYSVRQTVHFNYVSGFLLVDGKPAGRLPDRIRGSDEIKELFDAHIHLRTYPSLLSGMSHHLIAPVRGLQIHFGLRGNQVIVRAVSKRALLEFIPRKVFSKDGLYDLPMDLLENCVHFLNLSTGALQIHRRPNIWKLKERDWVIDLVTRQCTRGAEKSARLLCPYSETAQKVAKLFNHFERPEYLKIFLPTRKRLSVLLSRFELSFHVNKDRRLEETKLGKEVDPNQDAGTLHGLLSKLVLREVADVRRRTVIVPLGTSIFYSCGPHVVITTIPGATNAYAKYEIDDVLGRLICPPEPLLLYTKAHLHALTSFPIPDELTGRTGTEEAVYILESGMSQPWAPLGLNPTAELEAIAGLSPRRDFYPPDKRILQSMQWRPGLSCSIQHERLESLAQRLLRKSSRLRPFYENISDQDEMWTTTHLRRRAEIRRSIFDPPSIHLPDSTESANPLRSGGIFTGQLQPSQCAPPWTTPDRVYAARDSETNTKLALNVKHIVKATFARPFKLSKVPNLLSIFLGQSIVGGFQSGVPAPQGLGKLIEDDIIQQFGELVNFSRSVGAKRLYSLAFRLALLSFKSHTNLGLLEVLLAIAQLDPLKVLVPPQCPVFVDFDLAAPEVGDLEPLIRSVWPDVLRYGRGKKLDTDFHHNLLAYCEEDGRRLAEWFVKQWPSKSPSLHGFQPETTRVDEKLALDSIIEIWQRKARNLEFAQYIDEIQQILNKVAVADNGELHTAQIPFFSTELPHQLCREGPVIPSLPSELLNKTISTFEWDFSMASASVQPIQMQATSQPAKTVPSLEFDRLQGILAPLLSSQDQLRKRYGEDLSKSLQELRHAQRQSNDQSLGLQHQYNSASQMTFLIDQTRTAIAKHYQSIEKALAQGDDRSIWLRMADLWPGGKINLLEQLRSKSKVQFGVGMKEALVTFGIMNTNLQWLERLRHSLLTRDDAKLQEALKNRGHENWNPLHRPDWLLMELECDLLIRPEQVEVANAVISPRSGANSVLQMNMGQGKTSCIVPMAIAVLADTTQIARLVVPKALLLQSAQVVQSRIGGLVGREIRHIPFSRRTSSTDQILHLYRDLHKEIREDSGVLLTTSDHILSFKLSGLQRLVDSKSFEASAMIRFQESLTRYSRDIIDESDFTLAVKTQLIYPSGPQLSVDGAPTRWLIIQELLRLFEEHLHEIRRLYPFSVEVVPRSQMQAFPMAFLLRKDAEDKFHHLIIEDIVNNRTSFLQLSESGAPPIHVQRTIRHFLSEASTKTQDKDGLREVVNLFTDQELAGKTLLLLRGLILNRIMLFCMKRRYNVQYGLHPSRDPMAVPYEAKGVPSESSEFGHPDVAIILTTLSFYYAGLTPAQFRQSLSSVLKADDAASAYDQWIHGCDTLPDGLRHWNVINCDDDGQVAELYSHLRLDRNVLNLYLNTWVFPLYAKQFDLKLSASAWDIPNFPKPGKRALPGARSTGFSGTNDNKSLLPLTICQDDLPRLVGTNAEVLSYLLQPRNCKYYCASHFGTRMTEEQLLWKLSKEKRMILIDAGAYILEMSNQALVSKWLDINKQAKAGVYFGIDNRAWVLYRGVKKKRVPLVATPFADDLGECLVFLDEAHCRGTDLKLPRTARGALTLALGQTKDQTVQAAMRLRQLATTQSVAFFAGPEVHQSIIDVCKLSRPVNINSGHVVRWLLEQSCSANEQLANLHLAQGIDYCRRLDAQWKYDQFLMTPEDRMFLLNVIRQQERQTLKEQYGRLSDTHIKASPDEVAYPCLKRFISTLASQRRSMAGKLRASGMHSSALEEVEQEREVEYQVEEVRQVQKQKTFKPLAFRGLHRALSDFFQTGKLEGREGYVHAFSFMGSTSVGQKFMVRPTLSRFFVSQEFTRTVVLSKEGQDKHPDNFLRPVEWILWSTSTETALVIIPEEAELLIPMIRRAGANCMVHLITYSAPVTKSTLLNFNGLAYYNYPPLPDDHEFPKWFTIELGIFAGRLYVSPEECALVAQYLKMTELTGDQMDGPVEEEGTFARNPVTFMSEWLALRRQSDIQQTPMGYILRGRIGALQPDHAFFTVQTNEGQGVSEAPFSSGTRHEVHEEDGDGEDDDCSDLDHDGEGIDEGWDDLGEDFGDGFGEDIGQENVGEGLGEDPGRESPADG